LKPLVIISAMFVLLFVATGSSPAGVAVSPDGSRIYVADFMDNTISVIDTSSNAITAVTEVGLAPQAIGKLIGGLEPPGYTVTIEKQGDGSGTAWQYRNDVGEGVIQKVLDKKVKVEGVFIAGIGLTNVFATFLPPIKMSDAKAGVGTDWTTAGTAKLKAGPWTTNTTFNAQFTLSDLDQTTVPAGTFETLRLDNAITLAGYTIRESFFMAKGLGPVKDGPTEIPHSAKAETNHEGALRCHLQLPQ
jgi:YVTN family beta-propeller protein